MVKEFGFDPAQEGDELSQGDLLEWVGSHAKSPWYRYSLVVTADCDLSWNKHEGRVSYIPAFTTQDYVWHRWRISEFSQELDKAIAVSSTRLSKWRQRQDPSAGGITPDAVLQWFSRSSNDQVLTELGVINLGERNDLLNVMGRASTILALMKHENYDFDLLYECFALLKPNAKANPGLLTLALQKAFASLPGDVFHLPCEGRGVNGLFLMLRHINQCEGAAIAKTPDDIRFGEAKLKRVGRVAAPYRYAITQGLARVFSDIGLPADYEERCKMAAQKLLPEGDLA